VTKRIGVGITNMQLFGRLGPGVEWNGELNCKGRSDVSGSTLLDWRIVTMKQASFYDSCVNIPNRFYLTLYQYDVTIAMTSYPQQTTKCK